MSTWADFKRRALVETRKRQTNGQSNLESCTAFSQIVSGFLSGKTDPDTGKPFEPNYVTVRASFSQNTGNVPDATDEDFETTGKPVTYISPTGEWHAHCIVLCKRFLIDATPDRKGKDFGGNSIIVWPCTDTGKILRVSDPKEIVFYKFWPDDKTYHRTLDFQSDQTRKKLAAIAETLENDKEFKDWVPFK
ncbi:MAG TPA: hypothetical protein VKX17_15860 [Planctomycetota bacterium]|nr:hypothetical protein [Planctomycetota bacterium]